MRMAGSDWDDAFAQGQAVIDADVDVLLTHLVPHCQTADEIERLSKDFSSSGNQVFSRP